MHTQIKHLTETTVKLLITADDDQLSSAKQQVLQRLKQEVKVPGFRSGHVPPAVAEKYIDANTLQSNVLDIVINNIYRQAVEQHKLRTVDQPEINLKKFVPYTELEIEATVEILGEIKLPDYTKIRLKRTTVNVTEKDITDVIEALRNRASEKQSVQRAAKNDDEVIIDFSGEDAATGDRIQGADGKAYPLLLGSDTFIPGFEANLLGMTPGDTKTFELTFPKNYGVKALQSRKVIFTVNLTTVNELSRPDIDDSFASKVGPVKTLDELKADIKKQLTLERQNESERAFENELVEKIVELSSLSVPKTLINEEIERLEIEERRNLTYRGQTWQEHLKEEGLSEQEHREQKRPQAELRLKGGLVLTEIAEKEGLSVSPEELEIRLQLLKGQYQDKQMQAELDKAENQRDIQNRLLTEKTLTKLKQYISSV
jgi:trigger factor